MLAIMSFLEEKRRNMSESLVRIWEDCGFDHETIVRKMEETNKEIEDYCNIILDREQSKKAEMTSRLDGLKYEAAQLSKELDIKFNVDGYNYLPLCESIKQLEKEVKNLNAKKSLEMEFFSQIIKKEEELCSCLGIPPEIKSEDRLPSKEEINAYNERLGRLQSKKVTLLNTYKEKKKHIVPLLEQLEYCPSNSFERELLIEDDNKFRLTEENMAQLNEFESTLQRKIKEREDYVSGLLSKISKLWTRINESPTYQADFCTRNGGLRTSTIKALEEELKRCQEKRRENIPHCLKVVRGEIMELWDKCCIGREKRSNFLEYYSDSCSETLLDILELEANKLNKFYQENRNLLDLAAHHKQLWARLMELEKRSHDKERLFKNRGGELLKEEKERNSLRKELPKVENRIKDLVKKYHERRNEPFFYFDEDIVEKMEEQWRLLKESRQQNSSSQKEYATSEKNGSKRKLQSQLSSQKCKQFKPVQKEHEIPATRNIQRRLIPPSTVVNDTFSLGVQVIEEPSYSNFKDNIKWKSSLKREVFKDVNSRPMGNQARAPVKPPRKNMKSKITVRRLSSEIGPEADLRPRMRRSSLPNFEMQ